jgi:uncharacterized protein YbjT (DUF2867 family)
MRLLVTGATGLIASAIVKELISAGHQVTGLARADASAKKLTASGAQMLRGSIEDLNCLRRGADAADGAIHTAFYQHTQDCLVKEGCGSSHIFLWIAQEILT